MMRWFDILAAHPDIIKWAPAFAWAGPRLSAVAESVSVQGGYFFARDAAGDWHVVPDNEVDRAQFGDVAEFARVVRAATAHV